MSAVETKEDPEPSGWHWKAHRLQSVPSQRSSGRPDFSV